jgi:hypothetical protein
MLHRAMEKAKKGGYTPVVRSLYYSGGLLVGYFSLSALAEQFSYKYIFLIFLLSRLLLIEERTTAST